MAKNRTIADLCGRLAACILAVVLISALGGSGSFAQQPSVPEAMPTPPPPRSLQDSLLRHGDLTLRKSSLDAALLTISELWKVNIVVGNVEGEVNGVFKDAPLREILDSVLIGNGYGYRIVGQSIVVTPIGELGSVNPFFESTAIPLRNVKPSEIATAVEVLSTPQGQIRPLDTANSLIVVDYPDRVQKIRELAKQIDAATGNPGQALDENGRPQQLQVIYRHLHYISAVKATTALEAVLSEQGRISAVEGEDRIIIADLPQNLAMARTVLDHIDQPRPQVKIAALIYDISLQDLEELGLNWNSALKGRTDEEGNAQTAFSINSVTKTPFGEDTTGGTITFSNLSTTFDLSAVLLALQSASDARLLADPTVTVMDNEEAEFQSVSEIPFQQLTETSQGGQIGTTSFRDAGIKLKVKPKIAADGTIELDCTPEFSRLTGFTPGDNQPIIDRRTATTRLRVGNGQTIMIGGLRQRSDVGSFGGLPGLKDLRYVGPLFRVRETDIRESELVVFISPVLTSYAPPLACRDKCVLDTIHSRLDHIPQAEGAPPGCWQPPGPMQGPIGAPVIEPVGVPGPPATPSNAEPLPAGQTSARQLVPLPNAVKASSQVRELPRRLPPVGPRSVQVAARPEPGGSQYKAPPLRPAYNDRFRATAGVAASSSDSKPVAADSEEAKKERWFPWFSR